MQASFSGLVAGLACIQDPLSTMIPYQHSVDKTTPESK